MCKICWWNKPPVSILLNIRPTSTSIRSCLDGFLIYACARFYPPAIWAGAPPATAWTYTSRPVWTRGPWTWTAAAWRETGATPSCRLFATCIYSCCSWSPAGTCPRWWVCTIRGMCPWRTAAPASSCPRRPPRKPPRGSRCSVQAWQRRRRHRFTGATVVAVAVAWDVMWVRRGDYSSSTSANKPAKTNCLKRCYWHRTQGLPIISNKYNFANTTSRVVRLVVPPPVRQHISVMNYINV